MVSTTAQTLVTTLAGGQVAQARALIRTTLHELTGPKKRVEAIRRARAARLTLAALEAAEAAGMDGSEAWSRIASLVEALPALTGAEAMAEAMIKVLTGLREQPSKGASSDTDLEALTQLVTEHLEKRVQLKDVARQLKLHPTTITHRLQRKFGMSFSEYVGKLRVDKAKELLRRTRLPLRQVAQRVGIDDPSNLGRLFRRHEGMSPSAYRKQYGLK